MGKPDHDPSIDAEPHLRPGPAPDDASESRAENTLRRESAHRDAEEEAALHSVFDEPGMMPARMGTLIDRDWTCSQCGYNLRGLVVGRPCPECNHVEIYAPPPDDGVSYRTFYAGRKAATSLGKSWQAALLLALLGGPLAVLGALGRLASADFGAVFSMVIVGPLVEEVLKLAAAMMLVERRPYLVKSRAQLWVIAVGSAFAFSAIENVLYLSVYVPNPTIGLIVFRWSVCVVLHVVCTIIALQGLLRVWERVDLEQRRPRLGPALGTLVIAVLVHGGYNASVVAWSLLTYTF